MVSPTSMVTFCSWLACAKLDKSVIWDRCRFSFSTCRWGKLSQGGDFLRNVQPDTSTVNIETCLSSEMLLMSLISHRCKCNSTFTRLLASPKWGKADIRESSMANISLVTVDNLINSPSWTANWSGDNSSGMLPWTYKVKSPIAGKCGSFLSCAQFRWSVSFCKPWISLKSGSWASEQAVTSMLMLCKNESWFSFCISDFVSNIELRAIDSSPSFFFFSTGKPLIVVRFKSKVRLSSCGRSLMTGNSFIGVSAILRISVLSLVSCFRLPGKLAIVECAKSSFRHSSWFSKEKSGNSLIFVESVRLILRYHKEDNDRIESNLWMLLCSRLTVNFLRRVSALKSGSSVILLFFRFSVSSVRLLRLDNGLTFWPRESCKSNVRVVRLGSSLSVAKSTFELPKDKLNVSSRLSGLRSWSPVRRELPRRRISFFSSCKLPTGTKSLIDELLRFNVSVCK